MIAVPQRRKDRSDDWIPPREANELWLKLAEKRLADFRAGRMRGIPADEAFARARRSLRTRKS